MDSKGVGVDPERVRNVAGGGSWTMRLADVGAMTFNSMDVQAELNFIGRRDQVLKEALVSFRGCVVGSGEVVER